MFISTKDLQHVNVLYAADICSTTGVTKAVLCPILSV